jgi:hypothetical protein
MTYDVLLTKKKDRFIACVRQWPAIVAEGDTEEDALQKVRADLKAFLVGGKIVQLEVEATPDQHLWQPFAGMFADDPDWEAFQASMQQYRDEIDHGATLSHAPSGASYHRHHG